MDLGTPRGYDAASNWVARNAIRQTHSRALAEMPLVKPSHARFYVMQLLMKLLRKINLQIVSNVSYFIYVFVVIS